MLRHLHPLHPLHSSAALSPERLALAAALVVAQGLHEDCADHDITTRSCCPASLLESPVPFMLCARQPGILCGMDVLWAAFRHVGIASCQLDALSDGHVLHAGHRIVSGVAPLAAILSIERVLLNVMQYLSGIATATHHYVKAIEGTGAVIMDTRKTIPSMRLLSKYAVYQGGGLPHRLDLSSGILIKDNHREMTQSSISALVAQSRLSNPSAPIEVECETMDQVREAMDVGVDVIMLDNMTIADVQQAVFLGDDRVYFEASGGMTLENIRPYAETGVHFLSIGALTHSVMSLDIGLDYAPLASHCDRVLIP